MNSQPQFPLYAEMAISEIYYFEKYAIFLRSDNIIQVQIKEMFHGELQDAINVGECIKKISQGNKYPMLVIYSRFNTFSNENKEYSAEFTNIKAHALVSNVGLAFNILGNFYLRMNKPVTPTKLFTNVESALTWLKTFK